jgi:Flp pilus assembly protein TadG
MRHRVEISRPLARLLAPVLRYVGGQRGNVAVIFALSLIPLALAAGAGLDYARAIVVRQHMEQALDAAALAIGASSGQGDVSTLAQQYFNANFNLASSYGTPTSIVATPGTQSITLTVSDNMPTTILNAVGIAQLPVSASSTVKWGQTKLWVSLVLDNTGSMCDPDGQPCSTDTNPNTKINSLKAATHQLLTLLQNAAANAGDVQVAIVPFVKDVNVGTGNINATWIDWSIWDQTHGTCSISGYSTQSSCTSANGTWTWTTGTCSKSGYTTQNKCKNAGGTWTWTGGTCNVSGYTSQSTCQAVTGSWTPNRSTWKGCVTDRGTTSGPDTTYNYDVMNTAPTTTTSSKFTAEDYSYCSTLQTVVPLNYDWTALNSDVDAMVASGGTNQTIGLVWGWHALSQGDPLDAAALPANTTRYIIILSDGLNTQDRWYGNGSTQSTQVDARMNLVCSNAKHDGIVIYAVYVDVNGAQGNSTVLQNCATDSSKYYDLTSASQIQQAFNQIGQEITNLRVVQ